ncbi:MAG: WHG domain-containing protein [Gemmatimonadales bacterium]
MPRKDKAPAKRFVKSTREKILDAARYIYNRGGSEALTVRSLEIRAKVKAPTIFWHFGNMGAIADAIVDEAYAGLLSALATQPPIDDPVSALYSAARVYRDFALDNPHLYTTMFIAEDPSRAIGHWQRDTPGRETFEVLERCVRRCIESNAISPGDPRAIAVMVWSAAHGQIALSISGRLILDRPAFDRLYDRMMVTIVNGLRQHKLAASGLVDPGHPELYKVEV